MQSKLRHSGQIGHGIATMSGELWTQPLSITVEQAEPTKVVMTFSKAETKTVASDYAITGFTISSLTRDVTNKILTLNLSSAIAYGDSLSVVKSGSLYPITNNITHPLALDTNTVAWYDSLELSSITEVGGLVSKWSDKLHSGRDLSAATTQRPTLSANGITFDGIANRLKSAAFTLNQPFFLYMVINQIGWTNGRYIFDGISNNTAIIYQSAPTPGISCYAGSGSGTELNMAIGITSIVRVLFNGVLSKLIVNDNAPITGDFGTQIAAGITIGSKGDGVSAFSNVLFKELIVRNISDSPVDEAKINAYLKKKYSL